MSVAFTREESAETAGAVELPDRSISLHLNLVTQSGLMALDSAMAAARAAYHAGQQIEDLNERRNAVAAASRDMRYFAERLSTAQLMPDPVERDTVAFGSRVTFARDDGRRQTFRIVGEDEADPRAGSISYVSPVAARTYREGGRRSRRPCRPRDRGPCRRIERSLAEGDSP
jgi:transcription elongation GreA/GreB family factor